jgi:hypothetical protein
MEMKKREIAAILLALVLMLTVAACTGSSSGGGGGGTQTALAYGIYSQASEALSKVNSLAANTQVIMKMFADGEELEVIMNGLIKVVRLNETEVEMELAMQTISEDITEFKAYYKDGLYYLDSKDSKFSMEIPLEQIIKQTTSTTEALDFPETVVKNQKMTETGGGKELIFTLDGGAMIDEVAAQLGDFAENMMVEGVEIVFGDIEYAVIIDEQDNLKETRMSFDMEMKMLEETAFINAEIRMEYLQINNVIIDFPDDLETYEYLGDFS